MSLAGAIREALSPQPRGDELRPSGPLDSMAAFGLIVAGLLYVWYDTLGGVIRGVFGSIGLTPLIYLPAVAAIPALLLTLLARIGDPRTAAGTLAVLAFIGVDAVLSVFLGRRVEAVLLELYICLPIIVMMALAQRRMQDRVIDAMVAMFFVATLGVLLNSVIRFPWADATYEVMGMQRAAARDWTAGGHVRLAGFSRASYAAAGQILIGYCAVEHRVRSLAMRAACWLVGLIAVYLTTSKSPTLAMALLPVTYVLIGRIRATDGARRRTLASLLIGAWLLLIFIGPLVSMTYGTSLYPQGAGIGASYNSLADRVLNTWPNALAMVDWRNLVNIVVGRGLGGIGGPTAVFNPPGNPADNLAVYLFVTFGALACVFAYLIFRGGQHAIASGGRGRRDFAMIVAMLGIGAAANVVEAAVSAMVLGLAFARQTQRARSPSRSPGSEPQQRRTRRSRRVREPGDAPLASRQG